MLLIICCLCACAFAEPIRVWTDDQGRTVEARYLSSDDSVVVLQLEDGRESRFPIAKLSPEDLTYLQKIRGAQTEHDPTKTAQNLPAPNFQSDWPATVKNASSGEVTTVLEDVEKGEFIYESDHYQFISDVRLAQSLVKGFATVFESTHAFCRALPLGLNQVSANGRKHQIFLFEKVKTYWKKGGPLNSLGVYLSDSKIIMVPLTSLGVKKVGSGYMLNLDECSKTLPHELTHQLTPDPYYEIGSVGWFIEGIAEYVATTPYRSGTFMAASNVDEIIDYATAFDRDSMVGRNVGEVIQMPPLEQFLMRNYQDPYPDMNQLYAVSLLLTTYFIKMDGEGDGRRLQAFLKALHAGKKGQEALDFLLDGRSYGQLEQDVAKAWKSKGIRIFFAG